MRRTTDSSPEARDNFLTHVSIVADDGQLKGAFKRYLDIVERCLESDVELGTGYTANLKEDGTYMFLLKREGDNVRGTILDLVQPKVPIAFDYNWKVEEVV